MESKDEGVHFTQQDEKESVTFKVRFAQFKHTVGPKEGLAGGYCLKWFNILLSIILLVVGFTCLIMGVICLAKYNQPFNYIATAYLNIVAVFIVSGIMMIVAGALGFYCIAKKSYSSLMACLIILPVLIILHFILGGLAFSYRSRTDLLTEKALLEGFHMYHLHNPAREFMDWSQERFKCCGSNGPADYNLQTHSSTKAPLPTTHKVSTTKGTSNATITTFPLTTKGNGTTAVPEITTPVPEITTLTQNNTTVALNTTVTGTTIGTSTKKVPSTTLPPSTTTKAVPKVTTQATSTNVPTTNVPTTNVPTTNVPTTNVPTTNVPTTKVPTTIGTETSTEAKTAVNDLVFAMAGQSFLKKKSGLPDSCCKETVSSKPCSSRPHDIYKHGCFKGVDSYLKEIMCTMGTISFVMIAFELLHLITGALCSKTIKAQSGYSKV